MTSRARLEQLDVACYDNRWKIVKPLLESAADPNQKFKLGKRPLHHAALGGGTECAQLLIDHKADVNQLDDAGCPPLFYTSKSGAAGVAKLLAEADADINFVDLKSGLATIDVCLRHADMDGVSTVLKAKGAQHKSRLAAAMFAVSAFASTIKDKDVNKKESKAGGALKQAAG